MRVNRAVLSEILGVSEAGLTTWADQGMPVKRDGRGTEWEADPADCFAWALQRERDRIAATGPVAEQRARLLRAQAAIAEMEARRLAGELVVAADVATTTFSVQRAVRDRMAGIADRIAPIVAAETDVACCHSIIAAEVRVALGDVVDGLRDTPAAVGAAQVADLPAPAGDAPAHPIHP